MSDLLCYTFELTINVINLSTAIISLIFLANQSCFVTYLNCFIAHLSCLPISWNITTLYSCSTTKDASLLIWVALLHIWVAYSSIMIIASSLPPKLFYCASELLRSVFELPTGVSYWYYESSFFLPSTGVSFLLIPCTTDFKYHKYSYFIIHSNIINVHFKILFK